MKQWLNNRWTIVIVCIASIFLIILGLGVENAESADLGRKWNANFPRTSTEYELDVIRYGNSITLTPINNFFEIKGTINDNYFSGDIYCLDQEPIKCRGEAIGTATFTLNPPKGTFSGEFCCCKYSEKALETAIGIPADYLCEDWKASGNVIGYCLPRGCVDSGVRFSDMSGQVDYRSNNDPDAWITAEMKSCLCVDDHVRTGEDSSAILSFADLTTFAMKPETEVILDTPPQKDSKVKLVSGNIWGNVKKMLIEGQMDIEMTQAVSSIKGTIFICEETGTKSTVKVLEGTVSFKSKATSEEILVNAGEMATVTTSGLSGPQPFDVEIENASWKKYLQPTETVETEKSQIIYDN